MEPAVKNETLMELSNLNHIQMHLIIKYTLKEN